MSWRQRLADHLRSGQVSRVVYGAIIGMALILTMEAHPPGMPATVGTLLATAVAVALAELYSEVIGSRARAGMGGSPEPFESVAVDAVAVAFGIAFPVVFFIAAMLGLMDDDTAFTFAKWSGLGLIAGYGYVAARLSGFSTTRSLLQAGGVAVVAGTLIVFKAVLH